MYMNKAVKSGKKNNNQGYSLIEILIAIAIFSFGILAIAALQISSTGSSSSARKITDATYYAEFALETLMSLPWDDANLTEGAHNDVPEAGYTIQWNVTNSDLDANGKVNSKIIDLTVSHDAFDIGNISLRYIYSLMTEE